MKCPSAGATFNCAESRGILTERPTQGCTPDLPAPRKDCFFTSRVFSVTRLRVRFFVRTIGCAGSVSAERLNNSENAFVSPSSGDNSATLPAPPPTRNSRPSTLTTATNLFSPSGTVAVTRRRRPLLSDENRALNHRQIRVNNPVADAARRTGSLPSNPGIENANFCCALGALFFRALMSNPLSVPLNDHQRPQTRSTLQAVRSHAMEDRCFDERWFPGRFRP